MGAQYFRTEPRPVASVQRAIKWGQSRLAGRCGKDDAVLGRRERSGRYTVRRRQTPDARFVSAGASGPI
jgi:hypothetical protein